MMNARLLPAALTALALLVLPSAARAAAHDSSASFPAAGVTSLEVNVGFHDVLVRVGGSEVRVAVRTEARGLDEARLAKAAHPTVARRGGAVTVESPRPGPAFTLASLSGRVVVDLPVRRRVEIRTASGDCTVSGEATGALVECRTASGDVTLATTAPEAEITTGSGNVTVGGPVERLTVRTASGNVRAEARRADVRTISGDVRIGGLVGPLALATASGNVEAAWSSAPRGTRADVRAVSGDVRLSLPDGARPGGPLRSISGDIRSDFAGDGAGEFESRLDLRGDGVRVDVQTTSGEIAVLRR